MKQCFVIIWLSGKDMWHDKRMTLCLILTVASIALPLLLFFGLKNGAMEVLRKRMLNDPVYMEIMVEDSPSHDAAWFERWQANPLVGFVVPRTRSLAASGLFLRADNHTGAKAKADLVPTAAGDWLLQSYQVPIPGLEECVLSAKVAEALGVTAPGTAITVQVDRQRTSGGTEIGERTMVVSGILPLAAGGLMHVYVPLEQLERMENYRDGRAVPEFGWGGAHTTVPPVFHAALLYSPNSPDPLKIPLIQQQAGFVRVQTLYAPGAAPPYLMPPDFKAGAGLYRMEAGNNPADSIKMNALRNILRGENAMVIPLGEKTADVPGIQVSLQGSLFVTVQSTPLWATPPPEVLSQHPAWSGLDTAPAVVLVRPELAARFAESLAKAEFRAGEAGNSCSVPVRLVPSINAPADAVLVSPGFMGVLNQLHNRRLRVSTDALGEPVLMPGERDYHRFRMYASGLEQVAPLATALEVDGIRVSTRAAEIERVQMMDQYLTLLFAIIAAGSTLGGSVCLLSSLYANVERKRREFAVLRLIGTPGFALSAFPLTSGILVSLLGMGLALIVFHGLALYINSASARFVLSEENVCVLTGTQQVVAVALGLLAAVLAGLAAAMRLQGIEPAESLRDE